MKLPEFVMLEHHSLTGIGLILSTRPPYNVGRPIRFDSNEAYERFVIKNALQDKCFAVGGYNILVVWVGTIEDIFETIPNGSVVSTGAGRITELKKMADFYEHEKIKGNESRLKKYLRTY